MYDILSLKLSKFIPRNFGKMEKTFQEEFWKNKWFDVFIMLLTNQTKRERM